MAFAAYEFDSGIGVPLILGGPEDDLIDGTG